MVVSRSLEVRFFPENPEILDEAKRILDAIARYPGTYVGYSSERWAAAISSTVDPIPDGPLFVPYIFPCPICNSRRRNYAPPGTPVEVPYQEATFERWRSMSEAEKVLTVWKAVEPWMPMDFAP
jgi:hypothetical protein